MVGTTIPAMYARRKGWGFMASSQSQVVEQDRNRFRGKQKPDRQNGEQSPVKPGHLGGLLRQPAKHLRPQVTSQLPVRHRRNSTSEDVSNFSVILFAHGSTPSLFSFLRNNRTARKTRDLTAPTEIPNTWAICS